MKLLARYNNGNYNVKLYNNGTKVRYTNEEKFNAAFPENIDIKITDYCTAGCPFCHEDSSMKGNHGNILQVPFLDTLRPGTELAIGGGNPLDHPDLSNFLEKMKSQNIICNLTVNEKHFQQNEVFLEYLIKNELVHGIGISVNEYNEEIIEFAKKHDNIVLHIINGILSYEDLEAMFDEDLKILILGYKNFRRGSKYLDKVEELVEIVQDEIYVELDTIMHSFKTVSFDNLAIKQLEPERFMTKEEWQTFYMGDDGNHTMYIDMVKQEYALNSTSEKRYHLTSNIDDMFQTVKEEAYESSK